MAKRKTLKQKAQQVITAPGRFINSFGAEITAGRALELAKEEDKRDVPRKFLTTKELEGFKPRPGVLNPRKKKTKK